MSNVDSRSVTEADAQRWVAAFIGSTSTQRLSVARSVIETARDGERMAAELRKVRSLLAIDQLAE